MQSSWFDCWLRLFPNPYENPPKNGVATFIKPRGFFAREVKFAWKKKKHMQGKMAELFLLNLDMSVQKMCSRMAPHGEDFLED